MAGRNNETKYEDDKTAATKMKDEMNSSKKADATRGRLSTRGGPGGVPGGGETQNYSFFDHWRSRVVFFLIFDPLFAHREFMKKQPPQKAPRNLKISTLGCPRLDFSSILGTFLASIFMKTLRQPKPLKTQQASNGSSAITHPGLLLWHQKST